MHLVCRVLHCPCGTFVSGGKPEGSKHDLKFQRATWHNLMGWVLGQIVISVWAVLYCMQNLHSFVSMIAEEDKEKIFKS
jgi:hypothetical protein